MTAAAALDPEPLSGSGSGADADDTVTVSWADFRAWERQLATSGQCSRPIRLRGRIDAIDLATGELARVYDTAAEHGCVLHVACGNRREAVCPACSNRSPPGRIAVAARPPDAGPQDAQLRQHPQATV